MTPKPQSGAIELFFGQGRSFAEIADKTGLLIDTVRGNIIKGMEAIAATDAHNAYNARNAHNSHNAPGEHSEQVLRAAKPAAIKPIPYIKGDREGANARDVELEAMQDEFLYEAIEGYDSCPSQGAECVRAAYDLERELTHKAFTARARRRLRTVLIS